MNKITRRHFLNRSLAGVGVLASAPVWSNDGTKRSTDDRVELGKTGIKVSRLAMGTGMRGTGKSSDQTRLGQEKFTELMRCGFDNGLNFFDMADFYGSHPFVKNALSGIPRDRYVMLSKIWFRRRMGDQSSGGAAETVNRFLKELGTDRLDICLLHCIMNDNWCEELKRTRDELSELKQKGVVRALGISCHSHGALKAAAEHPWTDVIMARINHMGGRKHRMDGTPEEISQTLKMARKNGKAIIGMKIFGEGTLVKPDEKDASMKYVSGNDLVDAMTIGMLSPEEVKDSIKRLNAALNA